MHVLWIKLFYVAAIFAAGLLGGRAASASAGITGRAKSMAIGEAFSGGIFLGAGLLHLLPDSIENFSKFAGDVDFPLGALVMGVGFLLILLFDHAAKGHVDRDVPSSANPPGHPFLLFMVLSIHSIIAGASLGLEGAGAASIAIFLAIMAHKSSAGFALGVSLVNSGVDEVRRRRTIWMFAVMTPLGVGLGTFLASAFSGTTDIIFEAWFDALAAGTFVYITTFDILPKAMKADKNHWLQWSMATVGFGLMAMIAIWT